MTEVTVDGKKYRPVDDEAAARLAERLREFKSESTTFWRNFFIERDTSSGKPWDLPAGERYGMYADGDEFAPFFSEAFLYNLLGKDEARSVLGIMRGLCELAGVEWR